MTKFISIWILLSILAAIINATASTSCELDHGWTELTIMFNNVGPVTHPDPKKNDAYGKLHGVLSGILAQPPCTTLVPRYQRLLKNHKPQISRLVQRYAKKVANVDYKTMAHLDPLFNQSTGFSVDDLADLDERVIDLSTQEIIVLMAKVVIVELYFAVHHPEKHAKFNSFLSNLIGYILTAENPNVALSDQERKSLEDLQMALDQLRKGWHTTQSANVLFLFFIFLIIVTVLIYLNGLTKRPGKAESENDNRDGDIESGRKRKSAIRMKY